MPHKAGFKNLINKYLPHGQREFFGIEIGCWQGEFCNDMLKNYGNLRMVTVDPSPHWRELIDRLGGDAQRLWVLNFPSDLAVEFIKKDGKQYDFVFIDGDHSYEQCKKDIINYAPLVRPGGIVSGHNYHKQNDSAHPGVHEAVDEIYGDKVKLEDDFIWYVQV